MPVDPERIRTALTGPPMAGNLRLLLVVLIVVAVTAVLAPVQVGAMWFYRPLARSLPVLWHRLALKLIGVRVHVVGERPAVRPLLIVSNHVSWSDILVLGSVMQLCFVAKREVRTWPGINLLAWLQRTVFVDRDRRHDSLNQAETIARRLLEGDVIVLFAEGTTGDGHRVAPFKSALFGAVHSALKESHVGSVTVQPVALAYTRLNGLPLGRYHQSRASWPGDVPLGPHLLAFLRVGAYDVDVVFAQPSTIDSATPRKHIAALTYERVRSAFASAMRMRA
jgi:lyso-ornithine lipid O-acyltransferase